MKIGVIAGTPTDTRMGIDYAVSQEKDSQKPGTYGICLQRKPT